MSKSEDNELRARSFESAAKSHAAVALWFGHTDAARLRLELGP